MTWIRAEKELPADGVRVLIAQKYPGLANKYIYVVGFVQHERESLAWYGPVSWHGAAAVLRGVKAWMKISEYDSRTIMGQLP